MIGAPTPFGEAIAYLRGKGILPTTLDTAQLSKVQAAIRRWADFSATVTNAEFIEEFRTLVGRVVDPAGQGGAPGSGMDIPTARTQLLDYLRSIDYRPDEGTEGTLKDLSSHARLDLIVRTNTQMAQGLGQHLQANDPEVIDAFPAQELFRLQIRKQPREWVNRWRAAGGRFYGGGRMIALKADDIWERISRFGNPYPPYDFNSGMWVKPVTREEAVRFGLMARGQRPQPSSTDLAPPMQAGVSGISGAVLDAVRAALPGAVVEDGILTIKEQ